MSNFGLFSQICTGIALIIILFGLAKGGYKNNHETEDIIGSHIAVGAGFLVLSLWELLLPMAILIAIVVAPLAATYFLARFIGKKVNNQ